MTGSELFAEFTPRQRPQCFISVCRTHLSAAMLEKVGREKNEQRVASCLHGSSVLENFQIRLSLFLSHMLIVTGSARRHSDVSEVSLLVRAAKASTHSVKVDWR